MKTTLDIPDALYRSFKVKTSANGEKMRNAVIAFIVAYNAGEWPRASGATEPKRSHARTKLRMPEWAGMAEPFITKYPNDPLDNEKMRDEIVAARRGGVV